VPFVLACFQVSAAPRLENPDSDEIDALFGLDTQITIICTTDANHEYIFSIKLRLSLFVSSLSFEKAFCFPYLVNRIPSEPIPSWPFPFHGHLPPKFSFHLPIRAGVLRCRANSKAPPKSENDAPTRRAFGNVRQHQHSFGLSAARTPSPEAPLKPERADSKVPLKGPTLQMKRV
jgi:hypothetical protein